MKFKFQGLSISFIRTHSHPSIYILSTKVFGYSGRVKPEISAAWPFAEKVCQPPALAFSERKGGTRHPISLGPCKMMISLQACPGASSMQLWGLNKSRNREKTRSWSSLGV